MITTVGLQGKCFFHDSSTHASHDYEIRSELFHIRVVAKHKNIETLFDPGEQVNLIYENIVKKLGLTTINNPKPYTLGWKHDNAKLQVTKQCRVGFVIASKLIDEANFIVCGTVLGSPHIYDRKLYILLIREKIQSHKG